MKVNLTGGSGFVGKNLLNYLSSIEVNQLHRNALKGNLKYLFDCDVFVHLAGKAHDLKNSADPRAYYEVNYELTKNLFDSFLASPASKFIFISSVKAVADKVEGILTEEYPPNPITDYGKSKLMAERYILSQQLPLGKSVYILRPCMIHGPFNKGNLNLLYKFVKNGIPYPLAKFENRRSFLSVENLCFIIRELIEQTNIPSGIYNVADNEAISTIDLFSILAKSLSIKPRLWAVSPNLIRFLAKVGDMLFLPLNTEKLNKLTEDYQVSNKKIIDAIGVNLPLSVAEGLKITANSFENKK